MITIASIFGTFCILSAVVQFAFFSLVLRNRPSAEVLVLEEVA
jgi:hypothetical protein